MWAVTSSFNSGEDPLARSLTGAFLQGYLQPSPCGLSPSRASLARQPGLIYMVAGGWGEGRGGRKKRETDRDREKEEEEEKGREEGQAREHDRDGCQSFCNLILALAPHHFCHRNKSTHTQNKGNTQVMAANRWGSLGAILEAAYHTVPGSIP